MNVQPRKRHRNLCCLQFLFLSMLTFVFLKKNIISLLRKFVYTCIYIFISFGLCIASVYPDATKVMKFQIVTLTLLSCEPTSKQEM